MNNDERRRRRVALNLNGSKIGTPVTSAHCAQRSGRMIGRFPPIAVVVRIDSGGSRLVQIRGGQDASPDPELDPFEKV